MGTQKLELPVLRRQPRLGLLLCALLLPACPAKKEAHRTDPGEPSPNASIMPAPLATTAEQPKLRSDGGPIGIPADSAGRLIIPDAGPVIPKPLADDQPLERDTLGIKDGTGLTLEAEFRWSDVPGPPTPAPEVDKDGMSKARNKTRLLASVDLAPAGRMRFTLTSSAFPLPPNTEFRARSDGYGTLVVWPDGQHYRVLAPGTLRAMFAERRADMTPLSAGRDRHKGNGSLLGYATLKSGIRTPVGELTLEQADVPGIGQAGQLLCRLLVELAAVDPASNVCKSDESALTPLRAEYRWTKKGNLTFEVTSVTRKQELPVGLLYVPPAAASFTLDRLPPKTSGILLSKSALASLRARPQASKQAAEPGAPGEGVIGVNNTSLLRYLLLDGVPVAWVPPGGERYVIGPLPGRYNVSWRDFFGAEVEAPQAVDLPARVVLGVEPDAGSSQP